MSRKKTSLSLDLLNKRAVEEFIPTNDQNQDLRLLPLDAISDRPKGNTRSLHQNHVSSLVDSILALGLILNNESIISTAASKVMVRVMQTNEELIIAKFVCDVVKE